MGLLVRCPVCTRIADERHFRRRKRVGEDWHDRCAWCEKEAKRRQSGARAAKYRLGQDYR